MKSFLPGTVSQSPAADGFYAPHDGRQVLPGMQSHQPVQVIRHHHEGQGIGTLESSLFTQNPDHNPRCIKI